MKEDFANLLKNGPWIAMFILTLAHFIVLAMRGGTMFYYFNYCVSKERLFDFLERLGLTQAPAAGESGGLWHNLLNTFGLIVDAEQKNVSSVGFSLFNMSSQFVTVIGVLCSTFLEIRFGKKVVALAGFSTTTIFMAGFVLLPPDAIATTYLLKWVRALCYAPTTPLLWAMFADVVDYAEWKTGRRTTGVIYATQRAGGTAIIPAKPPTPSLRTIGWWNVSRTTPSFSLIGAAACFFSTCLKKR